MSILTQITPAGKRIQFADETYAEVNQATGLVTIHEGQRTGSDQDWGGRCIGYLSLAQAIQIVKAAFGEAWDDGKGDHALGYSLTGQRTPERRQRMINQVRKATSRNERQAALDAAMDFDPALYMDLSAMYPVRRLAV